MLEDPDRHPLRYPLVRHRRRRRRRGAWRLLERRWPRVDRGRLVAGGVLAVVLLTLGWAVHRAHRVDPHREIAASLAMLHVGNYSAARSHALAATRADPDAGLAHAVLARAYLALGDGVAAEGELNRAAGTGFDMARGHQLLAEAKLLQNDPDGALDEAAKAPPRFAAYAGRIAARATALKGDVPAGEARLIGIVGRWPRDAAAWADLGRMRFDAGDVLGAADAVGFALAIDRGLLPALVLQGELVRSRYGLVAALPWFDAALARDAYYVPALVEQAASLGDSGRYAEMLASTRRLLAARPGEPRALYFEAVLAARAGQRDLARTLLGRMRGDIDHTPGVLLLGGALDYADGNVERAIERWRELVGRQPMNITARRLLGAALLRSGDPHGALDVLRPVAVRADADAYTLTLVARGFEAIGDRDWAGRFLDRAAALGEGTPTPFGSDDDVATLEDAVADAPHDPAQAVALVRALVDARRFDEALTRARTLADQGPGAPAAWLLLGDVLAAANKSGEAATAYARAADLRFDEPTMLRLVDALAHAGQRGRAAEALALYLAQNPGSIAAQRMVASLQVGAGEWRQAIATLEDLRDRTGSRDVTLLGALSAAYLGAGDAEAARDYARAAYRLQPANPVTADAYGWSLHLLADDAAAVQLLRQAAALAPRAGAVHWHLAQALTAAGDKASAQAAIMAALADPGFTDRAAAQALLKGL